MNVFGSSGYTIVIVEWDNENSLRFLVRRSRSRGTWLVAKWRSRQTDKAKLKQDEEVCLSTGIS